MTSFNEERLVIEDLSASNMGNYKCLARNVLEPTIKEFKVSIKEPATILSAGEDLESDDEMLILSCVVKGQPLPKISLLDDKKVLYSTSKMNLAQHFARSPSSVINLDARGKLIRRLTPRLSEKIKSEDQYYFEIVQLEDRSTKVSIMLYDPNMNKFSDLQCEAENIHGKDSKAFAIKLTTTSTQTPTSTNYIEFIDGKSAFISVPLQLDDEYVLPCNIEGSPEPTVEWIFVSIFCLVPL